MRSLGNGHSSPVRCKTKATLKKAFTKGPPSTYSKLKKDKWTREQLNIGHYPGSNIYLMKLEGGPDCLDLLKRGRKE